MATVTYTWNEVAAASVVNEQPIFSSLLDPAIAALSSGQYFAAWSGRTTLSTLWGRIIDGDGTPAGSEFPVNSSGILPRDASLAQLENGNVVMAFTGSGIGDGDIRYQLFTASGVPIGSDVLVDPAASLPGSHSDVAALADGGFVVTWARDTDFGGSIQAQIFNADGTPRSDVTTITVLGLDAARPSVAGLDGGGFVVAWETHGTELTQVQFVRYDANGDRQGGLLVDTVNRVGDVGDIQVVALEDGGFAVAYTANRGGASGNDITLQIFNADGTARTDYLRPNLHTAGEQDQPTLTVLSNGYIVVGWNDGGALVYQTYTPEGVAAGTNFAAAASGSVDSEIAGLTGGLLANVEEAAGPRAIRTSIHELTRTTIADVAGEVLQGDSLNDTIVAVSGNNILIGGGGDDTLLGGRGFDTAVFGGNFAAYAIDWSGATITLSSADGFVTTHKIDRFEFADGIVTQEDGNALVDDLFYLSRNLDVWNTHREAEAHYNQHGWTQGRDPNAFFSTNGYLSANGDVDAANVNPLEHYHQLGWLEGRDASASFDTELYLLFNPDVANAHTDPLEHFLQYGREEGRAAHAAVGRNLAGDFDGEFYLLSNPDVGLAGADPLAHFNMFGWSEGRDPNAFFDTSAYLAAYGDVAAADVNPLDHYHQFGWLEGRDPSGAFDTDAYLAAYADVAAANVDPLEHFLKFGIYEGRSAFADGAIA